MHSPSEREYCAGDHQQRKGDCDRQVDKAFLRRESVRFGESETSHNEAPDREKELETQIKNDDRTASMRDEVEKNLSRIRLGADVEFAHQNRERNAIDRRPNDRSHSPTEGCPNIGDGAGAAE